MMVKKRLGDHTSHRRATPADAEIGKLVRERRHKLGLSQTELAEQIGVTFQQVQKYEKGTNRIGASRLEKIAAALNVKVAAFFEKTDTSMFTESLLGRALTNDEVRLVRAFDTIQNRATRKILVSLAEAFLDEEEAAAPDPGP